MSYFLLYTICCWACLAPDSMRGDSYVALSQELLPQGEVSNSREIVINMESYEFTPSEVTIEAGKAITLILNNQSFLVPHNFLMENPMVFVC